MSRAISGGQLMHRVEPVYPAQARLLRLEGTVILAATVIEDGNGARSQKLLKGSPVACRSRHGCSEALALQAFLSSTEKPVKERDRDQR